MNNRNDGNIYSQMRRGIPCGCPFGKNDILVQGTGIVGMDSISALMVRRTSSEEERV
jgi:hypothetical protein